MEFNLIDTKKMEQAEKLSSFFRRIALYIQHDCEFRYHKIFA